MLRTTRTVSPVWLRARTLPPFERTWDAAEAALLADPPEARRIDELAEDLARNGFQSPVVVQRYRWFSLRPHVGDGMHRSIAAMRIGIRIPIVRTYPPGYDEDVYTVTATGTDSADLLDAAMSLSSFRCTAGPWIQCDGGSAVRGVGAQLVLPRHPELRPLIAAELAERFRSVGIDAEVAFLEESD